MNIIYFALCTNDYFYHAQTCTNDSLSIGTVFYELLPWHCSREVGSAYVCMNITHFALCTNDYYHAQTCINDSLSIGIVFITFFVHGTARVKLAVQTYIYFISLDLPRTIVYTRIWCTSDAQSIGKYKK